LKLQPGSNVLSNSQNIKFQSKGDELAGTLVRNAADVNNITVLMIHGSGPFDRNQNMKGQTLDVFNTIASELGCGGVGSFRYDKRGCGESEGDFYTTGFNDLIEDACAAVDMLVRRQDTGVIILLGHSEGTMIAPVVANMKPEVRGLILLCPTVQPVEDTLMLQSEHVEELINEMPGVWGVFARIYSRFKGGMNNSQRNLIELVKVTPRKTVRSMGMKVPVVWLRELLAHNPKEWMRKVSVPVLTISGEKDIQCLPSDSNQISNMVQGPVQSYCLKDLTHILRTDSEPASFRRYEELMKKKIDSEIINLCLDWLADSKFARCSWHASNRNPPGHT